MVRRLTRILQSAFFISLLALTDVAAFLAAIAVAALLRAQIFTHLKWFRLEPVPLADQLRVGGPGAVFLLLVILAFEKLYTRRRAFWEEARALIKGATLTFVLIMTLVFLTRSYTFFSRATIVLAWGLSLFLLPFGRLALKKLLKGSRVGRKSVLIIGTNSVAELLAKEIEKNDYLGYRVAGFLGARAMGDERFVDEASVVGDLAELPAVVDRLGVRDVFIALPNLSERDLFLTIRQSEMVVERIRIVSRVGSLYFMGLEVESLGDVTSLAVACNMAKPWNVRIKHALSFLTALILAVGLAPLGLLIALAIRLDSRGPILFRQDRLGKNGVVFRFLKFRSMHVEGDRLLAAHLEAHPEAREQWARFQKLKGFDPRVTRVGRLLRRLSLDELPQLLNVLSGDMDLVGPRPYLPREQELMGLASPIITRVRPGITGLWQVRGRNLLSFDRRLVLDEYYIRNWSLWLDIVILMKTVRVLARREGAF
ncbi:MAG: undecaprenyl-phosphate galactose phosphotransferase WbaP [Candidatus Aminicenantes bacterium]|nr:undecaprenyl-phosphate galactose phosphotransferase WbaP [Candidatus Aminicenantes bacterium]